MENKTWLIDAYRSNNSIILWLKQQSKNIRIEKSFEPTFYVQIDQESKKFFKRHAIPEVCVRKQTYMKTKQRVFALHTQCNDYEKQIRTIEQETKYRAVLYNADVTPEYQYLYKKNLQPFCLIHPESLERIPTQDHANLKSIRITVSSDLKKISLGKTQFIGDDYLNRFTQTFIAEDPDVIFMERAFSMLPKLNDLLLQHNIRCPFHRWDEAPIKYKGGKSFHSYGKVRFHEFAIRLHGRFLVDLSTTVGDDCETDAIIELSELCGMGFSHIASRSYGAVFQFAVIKELFSKSILVPYKEKPIDKPMHLLGLLKADRAGQTLDPKTGFHTDVAEIDFASMFPHIIYNHNISADTILTDKGPFAKVPGTTISITTRFQGITPKVLKPFIDRRMYYKQNPTAINKERSVGLKMVLVSSYGYLRFREFKLGLASAHMAICAYARRILLQAVRLAEKYDFQVVHGIVDALYIKKKGITKEEVQKYCEELHQLSGIPVSFEGIFSWICFCASVNNPDIPVPTKHFGVFTNGDVKARGIEIRERGKPKYVRTFQTKVLLELLDIKRAHDIKKKMPQLKTLYNDAVQQLSLATADDLKVRIALGESEYSTNIPQKAIVEKYKKKGIQLQPGQVIYHIYTTRGVALPEEYKQNPHQDEYQKMLFRALHQICQPFGIKREELLEYLQIERQTQLKEYQRFKEVYIPIPKKYEDYRGVSEQLIRKDLQKKGWLVWRGGLIHYAGQKHEYPNVQKKYELLAQLLDKYHPDVRDHLSYICRVHHGMPDFICYKDGRFLFVECKLAYETIKTGQRICAQKLTDLGFEVQIHRIVHEPTKVRVAYVDTNMRRAQIVDRQLALKI
ncbi:MAG TPA: DNA polymerase domain-containing protein [Acidobacteriota bacterium]|nr:DNA polymerase domain-containing protein [Acidobacteriota bacterium]